MLPCALVIITSLEGPVVDKKFRACFFAAVALVVAVTPVHSASAEEVPGSPYVATRADVERLYETLLSAVQAGATTQDFSLMENVSGSGHEVIDACRYWRRVKDVRTMFLTNYTIVTKWLYDRREALVEQRHNKQVSAVKAQVCSGKKLVISSRISTFIAAPIVSNPYFEIDCELGQIDGDLRDLSAWWNELNSPESLAVLAPPYQEHVGCVPYCSLAHLVRMDVQPNHQQDHTPSGVDHVLQFSMNDLTDGQCTGVTSALALMSTTLSITIAPAVNDGQEMCGKVTDLESGQQASVCGKFKNTDQGDRSQSKVDLVVDLDSQHIYVEGHPGHAHALTLQLDTSWMPRNPSGEGRFMSVVLGRALIKFSVMSNPLVQPTNGPLITEALPSAGVGMVTIRYQ